MSDGQSNLYGYQPPSENGFGYGQPAQGTTLHAGSDAMVATATNFTTGQELDKVALQQTSGQTSLNQQDIDRMQQVVETRVKAVLAQGGSLDDAIAAASKGVNPELASAARALATQQYESSKPLLASNDGNKAPTQPLTLGSVFGAGDDKSQQPSVVDTVLNTAAAQQATKASESYILSDAARAGQPATFGAALEGMGGSFTPTGPSAVQRILNQGRGA